MFRVVSQLSAISHTSSSLASRVMRMPLSQPSRFFTQLPSPSPTEIELALRTAIDRRSSVKLTRLIHEFQYGSTSTGGSLNELKLTKADSHVIDLVMERIRDKYGIRSLTIDDTWETIAVVTYPEKWVRDEVQKKGKNLEDALISTVNYMVPKVSCKNMEDLIRMLSIQLPAPSEINQSSEDHPDGVDISKSRQPK